MSLRWWVNPGLQLSTIQPHAHSYPYCYQQDTGKNRRAKLKKLIGQDKDGLTGERNRRKTQNHKPPTKQQINPNKTNQPGDAKALTSSWSGDQCAVSLQETDTMEKVRHTPLQFLLLRLML